MTVYYADSVKGFFDSSVNKTLPQDAVEISEELYLTLLNNHSPENIIGMVNGLPALLPAPQESTAEIVARSEILQATYTKMASEAIAPLQDASDLGMATEAEESALKAWKTYRVLLNRVDLAAPVWPEIPANVA